MRCGIIVAIALTAMSAIALSATGAHADDEWCGYAAHEKSLIQCGYSSATECESAIGKGAMCFVDPEYALNSKRAAPTPAVKLPVGKG